MANISKIKLPNNSSLDVKALAIPIGTVDSTSTSTVFTFTVPGITSLYDGVIFAIRNTVVASASGWTANVNGLGAKQVYGSNNARVTTGFAKNYWYIFVYDETNDRWTQAMLTDANSTYTNVALGQGYGTCTTAAATTAKVVTLASYALTTGGIVAVKFDNDVPANATMNINSKGAKAIYHRGAAITDGVIKGGDTAYFIYNTYYHLLGVDRIPQSVEIIEINGNPHELADDPGSLPSGTYTKALAAIQSGKSVILRFEDYDRYDFTLNSDNDYSSGQLMFVHIASDTISSLSLVDDDSLFYDELGVESYSHKVTSLSSSSTDAQYPSAKCVYDNLTGKQSTLVSGTNIKTVNNNSLLGSGNISVGTVTGSSLTANNIILGNGSSAIKSSGKTIATTLGTDDTTVPTSKAVKDAIATMTQNEVDTLVNTIFS